MAERTVNQRQLEVLRWILDGCPDGVMPDVTYKTTAVALQNRRLVTVSKRRGAWKAEATAAGRHFAEHGFYPEGHWHTTAAPASANLPVPPPARTRSASATPAPTRARRITGQRPVDQMLADAKAAGAAGFTIEDRDRGHFQNLIRSAERSGKVPPGRQLRTERGDAGRTVVRLVDLPDSRADAATAIPVAERLNRPHPVVKNLRDARRLKGMRSEVRNRALRRP